MRQETLMHVCPDPASDASFDDDDESTYNTDASARASLANPGRQQIELF
jgi:hypothetical protein